MASIICHHNNKYNIYSTISDGFRFTSSITLEQLQSLVMEEQGQRGIDELPARLERAHKNGHSEIDGGSLDDFLCCNRAGENESHLSTDECIRRFLS